MEDFELILIYKLKKPPFPNKCYKIHTLLLSHTQYLSLQETLMSKNKLVKRTQTGQQILNFDRTSYSTTSIYRTTKLMHNIMLNSDPIRIIKWNIQHTRPHNSK